MHLEVDLKMNRFVTEICILQLLTFQGIHSKQGFLWYGDPTWDGHLSTSSSLWITTTNSRILCAFECNSDTSCETFFYIENNQECRGYSTTLMYDMQNAISAPGSRYYKVKCKGGRDYRYVREFDFCFKINFVDTISWKDAQTSCAADDGWLIELEDVKKAQWFISYLNSLPSGDKVMFWNGMTDESKEGTFTWSRSSINHPYSSSPWNNMWKENQPDDANGRQDCGILINVFMAGTYQFDDYNCNGLNQKQICECRAI